MGFYFEVLPVEIASARLLVVAQARAGRSTQVCSLGDWAPRRHCSEWVTLAEDLSDAPVVVPT